MNWEYFSVFGTQGTADDLHLLPSLKQGSVAGKVPEQLARYPDVAIDTGSARHQGECRILQLN